MSKELTKEALAVIENTYKEWCKKTKRNGGVLIGASIHELITVISTFVLENPSIYTLAGLHPTSAIDTAYKQGAEAGWDAALKYDKRPMSSVGTGNPPNKSQFLSSLPERCKEEWVKVSDRLPEGIGQFKDMTDFVMVHVSNGDEKCGSVGWGRYSHDRKRWFVTMPIYDRFNQYKLQEDNPIPEVIHWVPLPNPPQQ